MMWMWLEKQAEDVKSQKERLLGVQRVCTVYSK